MPMRDYAKELAGIMNALAESITSVSDEELIADAKEAGESIEVDAARLRERLLSTVKEYKRKCLTVARTEYETERHRIGARRFTLPGTPARRRALLDTVLASWPQLGAALTAQYRDLTALTDDDVASFLNELDVLGVLDKLQKPGGEREPA